MTMKNIKRKRYKPIIGEKGLQTIREFGLHRESAQNGINGYSFYSENGKVRLSDHWDETQPHDKDISKYLTPNNENMILGVRNEEGTFELMDVFKKESLEGKTTESKKPKTIPLEKAAQKLIEFYRKLNNSGNLKEAPQLFREDFKNLFPMLVSRNYNPSNVDNFIQRYNKFLPDLSGRTVA